MARKRSSPVVVISRTFLAEFQLFGSASFARGVETSCFIGDPLSVRSSTRNYLNFPPPRSLFSIHHSTCIALLRKIRDNRQSDIAWKNLTRPICFPEYLLSCLVLWEEKSIHLWKMDSLIELFNILPFIFCLICRQFFFLLLLVFTCFIVSLIFLYIYDTISFYIIQKIKDHFTIFIIIALFLQFYFVQKLILKNHMCHFIHYFFKLASIHEIRSSC